MVGGKYKRQNQNPIATTISPEGEKMCSVKDGEEMNFFFQKQTEQTVLCSLASVLSLRLSQHQQRHRSEIETSVATCPFNKPYLPYAMNVSI